MVENIGAMVDGLSVPSGQQVSVEAASPQYYLGLDGTGGQSNTFGNTASRFSTNEVSFFMFYMIFLCSPFNKVNIPPMMDSWNFENYTDNTNSGGSSADAQSSALMGSLFPQSFPEMQRYQDSPVISPTSRGITGGTFNGTDCNDSQIGEQVGEEYDAEGDDELLEQRETDDQLRHDQRREEQVLDEALAGQGSTVDREGDGHADREREHRREQGDLEARDEGSHERLVAQRLDQGKVVSVLLGDSI